MRKCGILFLISLLGMSTSAQEQGGISVSKMLLKQCPGLTGQLPPDSCCPGQAPESLPIPTSNLGSQCPPMAPNLLAASSVRAICTASGVQWFVREGHKKTEWSYYKQTLISNAVTQRCQRDARGGFGPRCVLEQRSCLLIETPAVTRAIEALKAKYENAPAKQSKQTQPRPLTDFVPASQ